METPRSACLVWCMILLETDVWMGTETGPVLVYDRFDRTFVCELRMHVGGVYCLAANRDRSRVYSGSNDFTGVSFTLFVVCLSQSTCLLRYFVYVCMLIKTFLVYACM